MANPQAGVLPSDVRNLIGPEPRRDSDQQLLERYVCQRDEGAFAGLVQRHGQTVWGVCRRVLHQSQDVEDAFQATFLILARKAPSIRKGEAVGSWLYGVAYRTALKARRSQTRLQLAQKRPAPLAPGVSREDRMEPSASSEAACRELQRILDEEVQRLPAKFRAPFVLCCLEGMSRAEAAQELGWKEGTLSGRLAQARKLLEKRLVRRGITLSAVLTATALARNSASAAAPAALVQDTPRAVLPGSGGAPSPAVLALAEALLRSMALGRVAMGLLLFLGLVLTTSGASLATARWGWESRKELAVQATTVDLGNKPPGQGRGPAFDPYVATLAFSPDGKRLVTAGARFNQPGHLRIYDVETARELVALAGIPGISSVAFSPDGQTLVSGEYSGQIELRDPVTGRERAGGLLQTTRIHRVAFAPDGQSLLSGSADGTLRFWDVKTMQEQRLLQEETGQVVAAAYFHHGKTLMTAEGDQTAVLWDAGTGKRRWTLRGHEHRIDAVAVSPDDKIAATASRDGTVRLWDPETGKETAVLRHGEGVVKALAFSPDGKFLATVMDRTIHFWMVQTRQRVGSLPQQARPITTLAFSPTGNYLACGNSLGLVLLALGFTEDGKPVFGKPSWQEYVQTFKGRTECPPDWTFSGADAPERVRLEPEGLRVVLPRGLPLDRYGSGLSAHLPVQGDFEITVSFEILHEPTPQETGEETRLSLEILLDPSAGKARAYAGRRVARDGIKFSGWQRVSDPKAPSGEADKFVTRPTKAKTGRLRLQRTGSMLTSLAAEGLDGEFIQLTQPWEFGQADLHEVRLAASPGGGPNAACDVRFTDLRLRAASVPNAPAAPAAAPPSGRKVWLPVALFGVGVLLLLGVWLLWGRWSLTRTEAEPVSVQEKPDQASVSFPCPECGKGLKVRAEWAGKKIRCPGCGKAVSAPDVAP